MSPLRRVAALVAATLVSTGLVSTGLGTTLASPASAATDSTLVWKINQQFFQHLSVHTFTGGASESVTGVITFPNGTGVIDDQTGAGTVQYEGSVTGAFPGYYAITFADPAVTVDADGNGEITAVVSNWSPESGGSESPTTPARVVLTTFDAGTDWADGSITATPHYDGVLPAGSETATALGIGDGKPIDGASFAPELLGQLTSDVRAHFYASSTTNKPNKAPSEFTATGETGTVTTPEEPTPTVSVATSYADQAVTFDVDGSGFTAVTNPGDAGIYVGLAPAGGLPDVSTQEGMDAFADSEWVRPTQMADGTWSVTLDPLTEDLVEGTDYAIYTWQAHTHSNTTQDTETAVQIDWSQLETPVVEPVATKVALKVSKKPTVKKAGKLAVTVKSADAGQVTVVVKKGSKTVVKKTLSVNAAGKATLALPKAGKKGGTFKVTATYAGTEDYQASSAKTSYKVKAAKKK